MIPVHLIVPRFQQVAARAAHRIRILRVAVPAPIDDRFEKYQTTNVSGQFQVAYF